MPALTEDDLFMTAVAQAVDALSFGQTHEADSDFRVHSKATVDSVRSLQREQRNRIEHEYGPRAPSPDFLGTQLLAEYRGEAASVQLAKESGDAEFPTAIANMTDTQCRTFKKEMKQRIHEWEGSVRDATGQAEVQADQKAALRSIYELYKASKNRMVALESTTRGPSGRSTVHEASMPATSAVSRPGTSAVAGHGAEPAQPGNRPAAVSDVKGSASAAAAGRHEDGTYSPPSPPVPGAASTSNADALAALEKIPRITIGTAPVESMSLAELQSEKRSLKQVLHKFESEFERITGTRPNRRERRGFTQEYHRYGELKNELAKRGSSD